MQTAIVAYFYKTSTAYFAQSVFWPIFLASMIIIPWPLNFIFSIAAYLTLMLSFKKYRDEIRWLKFGEWNKTTTFFTIPTILVSSSALILWVVLLKPDLSDLKAMVPTNSVIEIIIIGMLFSVFNAIWEEMIMKGILWDGIELFFKNAVFIIIFQAILFGIMHLNGFPRGIIGAFMAGIYGLMIGFIRESSKGLLAPIITHFFADATIFGILVWLKISG